jgi:membrane protease YdiL (CAAX protease family)
MANSKGARPAYSSETIGGWLPWGALTPFLGAGLVILALAPALILLGHFHLLDAKDDPVGLEGLCAFLLIPFATMTLLVFAWVRLVERRSPATIGLARANAAGTYLRGCLIGLASIFVLIAGISIAGGFTARGLFGAWASSRSLMSIALLLPCFAVQAGAEEILFRGWMLSALVYKFNRVIAIALTSLVFCALHLEPHQHWLFTMNVVLFSVFACCWALRSGNIWGIMGWHAAWNWLLAVGFEVPFTGYDAHMPALFVKLVDQGPVYLTGGAEGAEGSILCSVILTVGLAFLWLLRRRGNGVAG